ncbi:MAG: hypothetical protein ISS19_05145 [Bacteroidales bacterium]|nr:hypothetical protein [Bacteroidales bacterium]
MIRHLFLHSAQQFAWVKYISINKDKEIISILKELANDGRWRMREAVAFGFQIIGENDFNELRTIASDWIAQSNNYEKRVILVSLAHPKFLNSERAKFCFEITSQILLQIDTKEGFEVLRKAASYGVSERRIHNTTGAAVAEVISDKI